MYKAIFLDIDDTVFNFEKCSRFALKSSCEICHIPYQEKEFAIFQAIDNNLWSLQKKGELSVADVLRIRAEQLTQKLGQPKMSATFQKVFSEKLSVQTEMEPFVKEALEVLNQTVKIYAASNGILQMQRSRLGQARLLRFFSDLFVSDDIGYEKPDKRFFSECAYRAGLQNSEILMVGDSLSSDIVGARNSQIASCWYNPNKKALPEEYTPNYVINTLSQLSIILQGK